MVAIPMNLSCIKGLCLGLMAAGAALAAGEPVKAVAPSDLVRVVVVPVRDEIDDPTLFVLRRGLKQAIDEKAPMVVLDMSTPGGSAATALEMMEALEKFDGTTVTYVNREAMSAGAFIAAATNEIHFAPGGVMGAAAAVTSTGDDIPETMRLKLTSYLTGKVRAVSEGKGYRGEVLSAMIDRDYVLKIGDTTIKDKGSLLTLTATEASETYGDPPKPLLAAGIEPSLEALLDARYGAGHYVIERLEPTWSEVLAKWMVRISPVLMGLGLLALFVEFKTPGFGFFGISGIVLLALFFVSNYVAGLSGHEAALVFVLGLILIGLEIFLMPGVFVLMVSGLALILGSLLWSMADLWPNEPLRFSGEAFVHPLGNLGLGLAISVVGGVLLLRYLPRGWVWDRMVVGSVAGSASAGANSWIKVEVGGETLLGQTGVAATALRPGGQVEIAGKRYEARVEVGAVEPGARVRVTAQREFSLVVEEVS